jgi:N4-gp56 family major capsid protein
MSMHQFATATARIAKFKGAILKHAEPVEMLSKQGKQVKFPKNNSDTYVARRFLPYGATSTNSSTINRFYADATVTDRTNVITQAHQTQEGVTPLPDSVTPQDVTVVLQQYAVLYGFTDKTFDLYEDDIPQQMTIQIGERITFVNEQIIYGVLKTCTNVYYGGTGTSVATVNGTMTLSLIRRIVRNLQANHAKPVNRMLAASPNYGTEAVAEGYLVYCHTDLEPVVRDLPGFTPTEKYASGKPMPGEIGKVERFRFIGHPDLPSLQDGGAAIGATGLQSLTGATIDVYGLIVVAENAWSQVAVRGMESLKPTYLPPGKPTKSDQFGQRGYAGSIWWKAIMIENHGWMASCFVGVPTLA